MKIFIEFCWVFRRFFNSPWYALGAMVVVQTGASLLLPKKSFAMTAWGNLSAVCVAVLATSLLARNAWRARRTLRAFWALWSFGCFLWLANQASWTWYEVVLRRTMPDPFPGDSILFLHVVPFMAAVGLLPHALEESHKFYFSALNTAMLTVLWIYIYMFVVFPDEYVILHIPVYTSRYDVLYASENILLGLILLAAALATRGPWRKLYAHFLGASLLYTVGSTAQNLAITSEKYYTGSLYDLPYMVALAWFAWAAGMGGRLKLQPAEPDRITRKWIQLTQLANMMTVLMLPFFGLCTLLWDNSVPEFRNFRLYLTLSTMIVLGGFVMVRHHLTQRRMLQLLHAKQESYEHLERLQDKLLQKEKLAALGHLLAGAAHEINNPLTTILGYSELLCSDNSLREDVMQVVRKINQQARRTRSLVSDLLSFSQQASTDRALANVGGLVQRAVQIENLHAEGKRIRIEVQDHANLPRVWANINQLFQVFLELVQNACEFMEETKGGVLRIRFWSQDKRLFIEFADSGPGIREPNRVFDPFYTTKPLNRGSGLGLSAAYGILQKHKGEISCHNAPEGGAVFVVSLPIATEAVQAAVTSGN